MWPNSFVHCFKSSMHAWFCVNAEKSFGNVNPKIFAPFPSLWSAPWTASGHPQQTWRRWHWTDSNINHRITLIILWRCLIKIFETGQVRIDGLWIIIGKNNDKLTLMGISSPGRRSDPAAGLELFALLRPQRSNRRSVKNINYTGCSLRNTARKGWAIKQRKAKNTPDFPTQIKYV